MRPEKPCRQTKTANGTFFPRAAQIGMRAKTAPPVHRTDDLTCGCYHSGSLRRPRGRNRTCGTVCLLHELRVPLFLPFTRRGESFCEILAHPRSSLFTPPL